jgi:hypothetical protein
MLKNLIDYRDGKLPAVVDQVCVAVGLTVKATNIQTLRPIL